VSQVVSTMLRTVSLLAATCLVGLALLSLLFHSKTW